MDGIIIVNKPKGWTSFDVVAKIRNLIGGGKVGHSGTLDPMATGVLPIFLGKATKYIQYFLNGDKGYEAEMLLGVKTDTGDAEGKVIANKDFPDGPHPDPRKTIISAECPLPMGEGLVDKQMDFEKLVRAVFEKYKGTIMQTPPMYSAVKVNGQKLYELARKGIEIKREARKITIHSLRVTRYSLPSVSFEVICSKGTYIRQLAVDIGDELGCGAHLTKLKRTYAHPFHISQAIDLDVIITMAKAGILASVVLSPEELIIEMAKAVA
ncbi:MAG: tRNA pseudouridine(55) synthase TruB [Candidatus Margulisbacteria bacterium]|nr:tRNA pseudouridine(55) synthase TruB [Candidatus Margulisiibacteriota bacterium]